MDSNLYFLRNGHAIMIPEHNYDQEADLQDIIANNPNLLLRADDMDSNSLFLIKREFSISEGSDSSNAYSLDILLVDQTGAQPLRFVRIQLAGLTSRALAVRI